MQQFLMKQAFAVITTLNVVISKSSYGALAFYIGCMKSYEFFGKVMLRIPRFNKKAIEQELQDMLDNPAFRDAIYLASDSVYAELQKRNFRLADCDVKLRLALKKYQHRISYRATPFGGFASVSQTRWSSGAGQAPLQVYSDSFKTIMLDQESLADKDCGEEIFQANPALYAWGKNFRLYEGVQTDNNAARTFKLNELEGEGIAVDILMDNGRFSHDDLQRRLFQQGLNAEEAVSYIKELEENQLLLKIGDPPVLKFNSLLPGKVRTAGGARLYSHTGHQTNGAVDMKLQADLRDGINALEHLSILPTKTDLARYRQRFTALFDRQEVPLLLALDPEAGIDYGSNAAWAITQGIETPAESKSPAWSKVHELMLRKWTTHTGTELPAICLDEEDLASLEPAVAEHRAPGMMALFSNIPGGIHLHAVGGVSGLNMLGRFTLFDDELLQTAREISRLEQDRNPEVIFAEVLHESEELADRLNMRPQFRDYVIPVLTQTDIEAEHCLELNDLYLSVSGGKLILRSGRLNKRVIPRLSTAYNHRRDVFSVYRFLCDLQAEDTQPGLSFSMSALFPDMPFYPAVYYKAVLLEAASWQIKGEIFKALQKLDPENCLEAFHKLANELGLPELFMYGQGDQRLLIRRDCREDIQLLMTTVKNQKLVLLREYHEDKEGLVRDEQGDPYAHELVAFLLNKERVYKGIELPVPEIGDVHPGLLQEWIYFKVYMHPCGMDSFLLDHVKPFIEKCFELSLAEQWFFIRYHDTDDHLRIRLRSPESKESLLLKEFGTFLAAIKYLPNIRTIEMATYRRELERYAPIGMSAAEELFRLSSEFVLQTMRDIHPDDLISEFGKLPPYQGAGSPLILCSGHGRIIAGVQYLNAAFKAAGFTQDQLVKLSMGIYNSLFTRLKVNKELKVIYDEEYRYLSADLYNSIQNQPCISLPLTEQNESGLSSGKLTLEHISYTTETLSGCSRLYLHVLAEKLAPLNPEDKINILTDLNHMHLNRLFPDEPNYNEAQCYYYLYKVSLRKVIAG